MSALEAEVVKTAMELWAMRERFQTGKCSIKADDLSIAQILHDAACQALERARLRR